jgi:hypothetical protein
MRSERPWLAYACLAASMAVVGSYVGLSRVLVLAFPIFLLAWLRFGIAMPVRPSSRISACISVSTTPGRTAMEVMAGSSRARTRVRWLRAAFEAQ